MVSQRTPIRISKAFCEKVSGFLRQQWRIRGEWVVLTLLLLINLVALFGFYYLLPDF